MDSELKELALGSAGAPLEARAGISGGAASPNASIFVVDDEELIRGALEPLLESAGYVVSFAENGREALNMLNAQALPDVILFDLAMPTMNGWEFRSIQKNDPRLAGVPVVAISADRSPQAVAISAEAYIRKPFGAQELLDTIERILVSKRRQAEAVPPVQTADGLAALERLAGTVGHEINNPLTVVFMNLDESMRELGPSILALETPLKAPLTDLGADEIRTNLLGIAAMLTDGRAGAERIRDTVAKLAQLSQRDHNPGAAVDMDAVVDRALLRVRNRLGDRTRLVKCFGKVPVLRGQSAALEQAFVNLLLNAVEAIAEDDADWNEIRIVTRVSAGANGSDAVLEIYDSGVGLSPTVAARAFEPLFSTKSLGSGDGRGMGLSATRRIVLDHGGRVTVESQPTRGAVARVFFPIAATENAGTVGVGPLTIDVA